MKADGIFTGYFPTPAEQDPRVQIETFPWPVICAVNGFAITGGFELALACDILIASENASFADTHAKFGIAPAWGLSQKPLGLGSERERERERERVRGGSPPSPAEEEEEGLVLQSVRRRSDSYFVFLGVTYPYTISDHMRLLWCTLS